MGKCEIIHTDYNFILYEQQLISSVM